MKSTLSVLITGLALTMPLMAAESRPDPLVDPIPEQIQKGDISVTLEDFVQVPRTEDSAMPRQTNGAYARIQYMMPLPDGSGRLVINACEGQFTSLMKMAVTLQSILICVMKTLILVTQLSRMKRE